jgi:hypothetical protein
MKRIVLLIMVLALGMLLFVQCKRCKSEQLEDKVFTLQELAIVPYDTGEKYVFKNSSNDSMIYTVTSRNSNMVGPCYENYANDDAKCKMDYCYIENNQGAIVDTEHAGAIQFKLYYITPYGTFTFLNAIHLRIEFTTDQHRIFEGKYYFDEQNLSEQYPEYGEILAFDSTMSLGPKTFNSVYTLFHNYYSLETVYYNFSQGIVGFKSSDDHLWYLAN